MVVPYPPPRPPTPKKQESAPVARPVADKPVAARRVAEKPAAAWPVAGPAADPPMLAPAAAPVTPASLAAQSVGQVTNALGYLTRLPGALIGRATGSGGDRK